MKTKPQYVWVLLYESMFSKPTLLSVHSSRDGAENTRTRHQKTSVNIRYDIRKERVKK